MKIFIAGLCHETSAFSPITTNRQSFEDFGYHRPAGGKADAQSLDMNGYGVWVKEAAARGHDLIASTYAWAQPSGPCSRQGYDSLCEEILDDLRMAGDVSMVLLFLHGAQMAQGIDDCEGDFLARVRAVVGPSVFVGALLDLHANVTARMLREASVLVACLNYPHNDYEERAAQIYRLGMATMEGAVTPVSHYHRLPMIGMFYTTEPQMAGVNEAARALQSRPGVLSVSLIHGFLWADIEEMGAGVLVVTDGDQPTVAAEAEELARKFFDARSETRNLRRGVEDILDEVEGASPDPAGRPFVIADACDNAGGGAGSDSTFILDAILRRGLEGYAIGLLWDPIAAQLAAAAGPGAEFRMRLGGKTGPQAGNPLDVDVKVLAVKRDGVQSGIGYVAPTGLSVALDIAGNIVAVNDVRGQIFSPTCFTDLGINPNRQRALVVKSTQHFRDQFEPIARAVHYCDTPGALTLNIDPANYRNLRRPVWPIDDVSFEPVQVQ